MDKSKYGMRTITVSFEQSSRQIVSKFGCACGFCVGVVLCLCCCRNKGKFDWLRKMCGWLTKM